MKSLFKKLILNKTLAKLLLRTLLKIDNFVYLMIGQYASLASENGHPKHSIVKYTDWFISHLKSTMTVLDIGSNTGIMTEKISRQVTQAYGIEIEKKLFEIAEKKSSQKLLFFNADATKFDYSTINRIDCVTLSNVLEHIEYRVDFFKQLNEKINWKEKPIYLIRVPMIDRHWVVMLKKHYNIEHRLDKTHFIEYTKETFYREMNDSNLEITSFEVKWGEIYAVCKQF